MTNTSDEEAVQVEVSKGLATLRANLRALVKATHASEAQLAKACDVNARTIKRLLSDESGHEPRMSLVSALAQFFGLEVWQLLVPDLQLRRLPALMTDADHDWPFPGLDREVFRDLSLEQRIEIQGLVRRAIKDFEGQPGGGVSPSVEAA